MAFFINRSKIQSQGIVLQKKAGYCVEKALLLPTVARSLGGFGPAAICRRPESPYSAAAQGDLHLRQFVSTKSP